MKAIKTLMMAGVLLTVGLAAGGCASSGRTADASDHAVMCPKCETIWVRERSSIGARDVQRFSLKRDMTCPTCDKAAAAYLQDGKTVLHDCPDCKVTLKAYTPAKPMSHIGHKHQ